MAKTKYSSSRCKTFESCSLKYDLSYRRGYYAEESQQSVVTRKGNAFHFFAETYDPLWTDAEVEQKRLEIEKSYNIPEEYSLLNPIKRFVDFYKQVIALEVEKGAKFHREIQFDFDLDDNNFTGKLDILLEYPDGSFFIMDHKTGKGTTTSYYTDQMFLYAWALSKQYKVPEDILASKVQIGIFFPFANLEEEDVLKVFKKIKFTKEQLDKNRADIKNIISIIESKTWEPEATLNRMCEFCSFIGQKNLCPISANAGLYPIRGLKVKQKDWAIAAGIK